VRLNCLSLTEPRRHVCPLATKSTRLITNAFETLFDDAICTRYGMFTEPLLDIICDCRVSMRREYAAEQRSNEEVLSRTELTRDGVPVGLDIVPYERSSVFTRRH